MIHTPSKIWLWQKLSHSVKILGDSFPRLRRLWRLSLRCIHDVIKNGTKSLALIKIKQGLSLARHGRYGEIYYKLRKILMPSLDHFKVTSSGHIGIVGYVDGYLDEQNTDQSAGRQYVEIYGWAVYTYTQRPVKKTFVGIGERLIPSKFTRESRSDVNTALDLRNSEPVGWRHAIPKQYLAQGCYRMAVFALSRDGISLAKLGDQSVNVSHSKIATSRT